MTDVTLSVLRRTAVSYGLRSFADLQSALDAAAFVQADPIRAPARAQDLMLRHRVPGYLAGELEQRYTTLRVEEAFFINYGFVTPALFDTMHPRGSIASWPAKRRTQASALLAYLDEREDAVARWVFANGKSAGMTTDTLPAAKGIYLPLRTAQGMLGVLGLHPAAPQRFLAPEELHFLEAYANQLALGIERRAGS